MGSSLTAEESRAAFNTVMQGEATAAQIVGAADRPAREGRDAGRSRRRGGRAPRRDGAPAGGALRTISWTPAAPAAARSAPSTSPRRPRSLAAGAGRAHREARQPLVHLAVRQRGRARGARRSDRRGSCTVMERALRDAGIVFMFAPLMHPAMRHVGPVRRELGDPDRDEHRRPAGQSGRARGDRWSASPTRSAFRSSPARSSRSAPCTRWSCTASPGWTRSRRSAPTQRGRDPRRRTRASGRSIRSGYGFAEGRVEELAGGPPAQNAPPCSRCSRDERRRRRRAAVLLNAAAALYVSGLAEGGLRRIARRASKRRSTTARDSARSTGCVAAFTAT